MKIGILGTGTVGQTLASHLSGLGHQMMIGTRDPQATLARNDKDGFGNPPFRVWNEQHPAVKLATFAGAASHGEVAIAVLSGHGALAALGAAGEENLAGKVLIDVTNPLDFSKGFPPFLAVSNTDSLGEQVQKALPRTRVVKTLNTVSAPVMVAPGSVNGGDHTLFMAGNDAGAKGQVAGWLREWFGWKEIVDLGDITMARGTEMYLPLWVRLYGALGTPMFNIRLVR